MIVTGLFTAKVHPSNIAWVSALSIVTGMVMFIVLAVNVPSNSNSLFSTTTSVFNVPSSLKKSVHVSGVTMYLIGPFSVIVAVLAAAEAV